MINDSIWGNPYDCQTDVSLIGGSYTKKVEVPEKRVFGFVVRKSSKKDVRVHLNEGDMVPDDVEARRNFKYRCGLIKVINVFFGNESTMTIYLDGFRNIILDVRNTEFKFDPQLENGPVAEIFFQELCTRRGEISEGGTETFFAFLIFKDQDQMREFVVATTTTPDPEQKMVYHSSSYRNSRGSSSLWPLAAGVLLGVAISD